MSDMFVACAVAVAAVAAARSTWSPCGLSMLASITPLAEAGRGHRYRSTAAWFVVGGTVGGACLGLGLGGLAAAVRSAGVPRVTLAAVAVAAALVAAAADAGVAGFHLPVHRRQVNERWLDQFRPWVYGAGFGWQIGAGLVTYIRTSAVYLMIVLAALSAEPWLALSIGALFGLLRGLAVLLGRRITSPAALAAFHRRFSAAGPVMAALVVAVELAVAVLLAALVSPWAAAVLGAAAVAIGIRAGGRSRRLQAEAPGQHPGGEGLVPRHEAELGVGGVLVQAEAHGVQGVHREDVVVRVVPRGRGHAAVAGGPPVADAIGPVPLLGPRAARQPLR